MKLRILQSAKRDIREGHDFYELQKDGLGNYFIDSLFSDIESLKIYAGIHTIHFGKYYRLLSKRFPFAIYYIVGEDEIRIYAVIDCRRNPAWIRQKLQLNRRTIASTRPGNSAAIHCQPCYAHVHQQFGIRHDISVLSIIVYFHIFHWVQSI